MVETKRGNAGKEIRKCGKYNQSYSSLDLFLTRGTHSPTSTSVYLTRATESPAALAGSQSVSQCLCSEGRVFNREYYVSGCVGGVCVIRDTPEQQDKRERSTITSSSSSSG